MSNDGLNIPKNETFTWLQPGAWRKPCIVHVPDHHHMVLQVQRTMPRSIKEVLRGYMQGCKAEARKLGITENLYDGLPFYKVLTHKGQLHAMIKYVKANAERAWQRRQNPDLFRMHRKTGICGLQFTSMGNHFLLSWPDRQLVNMSRSATDEQISERLQTVLSAAHNGAITYTAAISAGERIIAKKVREQGFPLVVLLNDGFPSVGSPHERFYKLGGVYFDACSRGKLLLLEPDEGAFVQPALLLATKEALRRKAEERHLCYTDVPVDSKRYRFMALNEMGRLMVGADGICG